MALEMAMVVEKKASDCWLNKQLHKTRLCKHFLQGRCQLGESCTFAHSHFEMNHAPDLSKTQLCKAYEEGKCNNPNCTFAHGAENLCSTGAFYKKKLCAWFEKGSCRNGQHCRFAHGAQQLRDEEEAAAAAAARPAMVAGNQIAFGGGAMDDYSGVEQSSYASSSEFSIDPYTSDTSAVGAKAFWDPAKTASWTMGQPWSPWSPWTAMDQVEPAAEPMPQSPMNQCIAPPCFSPCYTMTVSNNAMTGCVAATPAQVTEKKHIPLVSPTQKVVPTSPWTKKESKSKPGKFFFFNTKTGETVWKKPEDFKDPSEELVKPEVEPEAEAMVEVPSIFSVSDLLRWQAAAATARPTGMTLVAAEMPSSAASSPDTRPMTPPRMTPSGRKQTSECLQASTTSWSAQQRLRRGAGAHSPSSQASLDAEVVRSVKAILNKLTIEKFPVLSRQLMEVEFENTRHVMILINEIFEKATTQHHYIEMYADLCEILHTFFIENPVSEDPRCDFKRLLLSECQHSFERNLTPPADLHKLNFEERTVAEVRYKTRMLGNIRFVGALLARHMLASRVLVAVLEELIMDPSPEALETLAALLTVTGPVFDTEEWAHIQQLNDIFDQVKAIAQKEDCSARVRCLLQDVLDLRAQGWEITRPLKMEGPKKLQDVAEQAAKERL